MWGWIKGDFDLLTEVVYLTLVKTCFTLGFLSYLFHKYIWSEKMKDRGESRHFERLSGNSFKAQEG